MFAPQNFAKALSSNFSWDDCTYPGEMKKKTKAMQNFGGLTWCIMGDVQMANLFVLGC